MPNRALTTTDLHVVWLGLAGLLAALPEYTVIVFISGVAGGTVRWGKQQLSVKLGLIAVTQGGVTAVFLWPFASPLISKIGFELQMTQAQEYMTGGFLIGLLCDFVLSLIWRRAEKLGGDDARDN